VGVGAYATWAPRHLVLGIVGGLFLYFLFGVALVVPAVAIAGEDSAESLLAQAVTVILWDLGLVCLVYVLVKKTGGTWRSLGFRRPRTVSPADNPWFGTLGLAFAASILFRVIAGVYVALIGLLGLDSLLPDDQIPSGFYEHSEVLWVLGISVVLTAPFAEEIFFRGFLYAGLRRYQGVLVAALISGTFFSLAHGNLGLLIPFILVGAALSYIYERTGSIYPSMSAHFMFNLGSFLILALVPAARN
jgi:membrane protease YdiL (CAAX protease family)